MNNETTQVCTTQEAARILGMSVSSVQKLVENGVIEAWKTSGGHRRIPMDAVLGYKVKIGDSNGLSLPESRIRLLIVEDDEMYKKLYQAQLASWNLPLEVSFCESGYDALIEIGVKAPDIFLTDILMKGMDGYEVVETILAKPALREMDVVMVSGIEPEDLERRGGVPPGVVFFSKPVPFDELRGYVKACCARRQRMRQGQATAN